MSSVQPSGLSVTIAYLKLSRNLRAIFVIIAMESAPCTSPSAAEHGADHVSTSPSAADNGAEHISTLTDVLRVCAPLLPDVEADRFHSAATILIEGKRALCKVSARRTEAGMCR